MQIKTALAKGLVFSHATMNVFGEEAVDTPAIAQEGLWDQVQDALEDVAGSVVVAGHHVVHSVKNRNGLITSHSERSLDTLRTDMYGDTVPWGTIDDVEWNMKRTVDFNNRGDCTLDPDRNGLVNIDIINKLLENTGYKVSKIKAVPIVAATTPPAPALEAPVVNNAAEAQAAQLAEQQAQFDEITAAAAAVADQQLAASNAALEQSQQQTAELAQSFASLQTMLMQFMQQQSQGTTTQAVFTSVDTNSDGVISADELGELSAEVGIEATEEQLEQIVSAVDGNDNEGIEIGELVPEQSDAPVAPTTTPPAPQAAVPQTPVAVGLCVPESSANDNDRYCQDTHTTQEECESEYFLCKWEANGDSSNSSSKKTKNLIQGAGKDSTKAPM
jgi:ribosomal protein L12E/L44/L45/RPP1/RPP2